jgi:hypothetical protein
MRKVTREIVSAFVRGQKKKIGNTRTDGTKIWLHGNMIAEKRNGELWITNAGWQSRTTMERLNGLPYVNIYQRNWQWYLNGHAWNGGWVNVSRNGGDWVQQVESFAENSVVEPEFDLSSVWIDEEGYSRPIYAVWHSNNVSTLDPIEEGLRVRGIHYRRMESDTEGVYRPNYFIIVRPDDFHSVLTTINQ